jgi:kynurenine formamidase
MSMKDELVSSTLNAFKVYDLGQPYFNGMPVHPEDPPFSMVVYRYHDIY